MARPARLLALVATLGVTGGLLAPPRRAMRARPLSSSSKPLPETSAPSLAKDLDGLPEEDAAEAVAGALAAEGDGAPAAAAAAAPEAADEYSDVRERIRARAEQLNLQGSAAPQEVFDVKPERNVLQQMADVAIEETQMEKDAETYSDGLSIVEGLQKEWAAVIWPGPQEVVNTLGLVVGITAFMVAYVLGVDKFLQTVLDPLFHYAGNQ
jgi:preprotein translocase SecE subunit